MAKPTNDSLVIGTSVVNVPWPNIVTSFSCNVSGEVSCSQSVDMCNTSTFQTSSGSNGKNCPDKCIAGGCPDNYTRNCHGDPPMGECGCCLNSDPIILNLRGPGVFLSSAANGVIWPVNKIGALARVAWPVRPNDDAFLALDRNGNGLIDDGSELFGNTTLLRNGTYPTHGYEALAELDSNGDDWVDRDDTDFGSLLVWKDSNRDGLSQPDELTSAGTNGLQRISVEARDSRRVDVYGNEFRYRAQTIFSTHPRVRWSWDVILRTQKLN